MTFRCRYRARIVLKQLPRQIQNAFKNFLITCDVGVVFIAVCMYVCKNLTNLWTDFDDLFKEECSCARDKSVSLGDPESVHTDGQKKNWRITKLLLGCVLRTTRIKTEQHGNGLRPLTSLPLKLNLTKNGNNFWKCWRSKFERPSKCAEVEGCVNLSQRFANYFSNTFSGNYPDRGWDAAMQFVLPVAIYSWPLCSRLQHCKPMCNRYIHGSSGNFGFGEHSWKPRSQHLWSLGVLPLGNFFKF